MALSSDPAALEAKLTEHVFLAADYPTREDSQTFNELGPQVPDRNAHPFLYAWYLLLNQFTPAMRESWPSLEVEKPEEEEKKEEGDDDMDLFGDDPEAEEAAKKLAEQKSKEKKVVVGRSNVVFDVKPASSTVNLDEVAEKIQETVVIEGLKWGEEYKKEAIGYGISKLRIGCVILDSISTDDVIDQISEMKGMVEEEEEDEEDEEGNIIPKEKGEPKMVEDYLVQSVDIVSFNKL